MSNDNNKVGDWLQENAAYTGVLRLEMLHCSFIGYLENMVFLYKNYRTKVWGHLQNTVFCTSF